MENTDLNLQHKYSQSCVRAGLAALLLAAVGFSLYQPLEQEKAAEAYFNYISERNLLRDALKTIKDAKCLIDLKNEKGDSTITYWNVQKIMDYKCKFQEVELKDKSGGNKFKASVALIGKIYYPDIAGILFTLLYGKEGVKYASKTSSFRYNQAVKEWSDLVFRIITKKCYSSKSTENSKKPQEGKPVCHVNQNEILSHMTLKDFETIVEYKLPQLSDLDLVQVELHSNFPGIGMPLNIKNSIFLLEISLLITVIYFWLCQNEAKQSQIYPGSGTIFATFTRTNINWFIFSVLCSFPPIIGFILALATESQPEIWVNLVVASLTFIFTFLVSLNFNKGSRPTQ